MTAEQAWNTLRTAAGAELGDRGYFSARALLGKAHRGRGVATGDFLTAAETLGLI